AMAVYYRFFARELPTPGSPEN
ncbi:MAG: hypothetical protein AVDCRST_MAG78-1261, partial [uncultured Rubrobacteraceae bacterium]